MELEQKIQFSHMQKNLDFHIITIFLNYNLFFSYKLSIANEHYACARNNNCMMIIITGTI